MSITERIRTRLEEGLSPSFLSIEDQSALHAGHSGARPGGETHFFIKVASERFAGKRSLERHRLVYALLAEEIAGGVHALALETRAPGEP
jgi:BolA protein